MSSNIWYQTTLGTGVDVLTGYPFISAQYTKDIMAIRLLRGDNIVQGSLRWEDTKRWDNSKLEGLTAYLLKPYDIVLAMDRPWIEAGLKYSAIQENDLPCLLVQRVARLRAREGFDQRFLKYIIGSQDFTEYILSVQTGTSVPHISSLQIKSYKFLCPPLPEQRAIARILGALDDKIELNRRMNRTLEAMAQAIFKSWFVDFDPVVAKAEGRQPYGMNAETAALFPAEFVDSELGAIPKGWRNVSIGEVMTNFDSQRIPLSGSQRLQRQGIYPYYGAASIMDHVDDYLFDGIYLLVGEDGSVTDKDGMAVTQYVWGKFWVNNHAHVLQGRNGICTEHLLLHYRFSPLLPYVTGAVQPKLNQANMNSMPFMLPTKDVAEAFRRSISPWFTLIRTNTDEIKTLASIRDTLLPRLLSGEVRLKGIT